MQHTLDSEDSVAQHWNLVTTDAGAKYYWNSETGETSWSPPAGVIVEAEKEIRIEDRDRENGLAPETMVCFINSEADSSDSF
jgi:hypothetical protein